MKSSNLQRIWIQQRQECVSLTIMDIYIGITSGQMTVILKTEAIIVRGLFCDHMIIHIHAGIFTTPVHLPHKISQFFGQYTSTIGPWFAYIWLVYLVKDTRHFWKISKLSMAMLNNHIVNYSYIMDFPWLCYIFGSRFPKPHLVGFFVHLPGRPGEGHPGAPRGHHRTPPFPKRKDPGLGP